MNFLCTSGLGEQASMAGRILLCKTLVFQPSHSPHTYGRARPAPTARFCCAKVCTFQCAQLHIRIILWPLVHS